MAIYEFAEAIHNEQCKIRAAMDGMLNAHRNGDIDGIRQSIDQLYGDAASGLRGKADAMAWRFIALLNPWDSVFLSLLLAPLAATASQLLLPANDPPLAHRRAKRAGAAKTGAARKGRLVKAVRSHAPVIVPPADGYFTPPVNGYFVPPENGYFAEAAFD